MKRESFVFYRSFKESLSDLSDADKLLLYEAISDYALNRIEPDLKGFPKALFSLIKPQLEANWKRYEAGINNGWKGAEHGKKGGRPKKEKPSNNPVETQSKPSNVNVNDNDNDNVNKEVHAPEFQKFNLWLKENCPYLSNPRNITQLTEKEFLKLKEAYSGTQISETLSQIENRKDLRKKYTSLYRTTLNWIKKNGQNTTA